MNCITKPLASRQCFWLQTTGQSLAREGLTVMAHARDIGYNVGWGGNPFDDFIPVGDVDYCEARLERKPLPDFAPEWLKEYFHREISLILNIGDKGIKLEADCFVKSADEYKKYPARVYKSGEMLPDGLLLVSDVVKFVQEWRYYVADGQVLTTGWYDGNDENEPAPKLNVNFPPGYCGAVDFGRLDTGEIALVEAQHPYACGWYGDKKDNKIYTLWLAKGWEYMKTL